MRRSVLLFLAILIFWVGLDLVIREAKSFHIALSLNGVASAIAGRPVNVRCYGDEPQSPAEYGAWGYVEVPTGKQQWEALDERLCAGASAPNSDLPDWQRALGVLVLTHESYHLRRWGGAGDEGKVECKAIRHWKTSMRLLGATEATVNDLWPWTLAVHYRLTDYVDLRTGERPYYEAGCDTPKLWDPPED